MTPSTTDRGAAPESAASQIGVILDGRWVLEGVIGRGGMGAVYEARQLSVDRRVAVKLIRPDLVVSERLKGRFLREGRILSALQHPHIVTLLDVGQDAATGTLYLVMERLEGEPLRELLARRRLTLAEAVELSRQLLSALGAAHRRGVIHRDVKPSNIMVKADAAGRLHLTLVDFGVARSDRPEDQGLTATGQIHGTPRYMAPEQITGDALTPSVDLYAAGLIMYRLLADGDAFEGDSAFDIFIKQVRERPPALTSRWSMAEPQAPALIQLVHRLLAKAPSARPGSADDALAALSALAAPPRQATPAPTPRRPTPTPARHATAPTEAPPSLQPPAPTPTNAWPPPLRRVRLSPAPHAVPPQPPRGASAPPSAPQTAQPTAAPRPTTPRPPRRRVAATSPEALPHHASRRVQIVSPMRALQARPLAPDDTLVTPALPYPNHLALTAPGPHPPQWAMAISMALFGALVAGLIAWSFWPEPAPRRALETLATPPPPVATAGAVVAPPPPTAPPTAPEPAATPEPAPPSTAPPSLEPAAPESEDPESKAPAQPTPKPAARAPRHSAPRNAGRRRATPRRPRNTRLERLLKELEEP